MGLRERDERMEEECEMTDEEKMARIKIQEINLKAQKPGMNTRLGMTKEERDEMMDEVEARTRQVYDPEKREFDDRRRRVTDLAECSRVTLPRPLSVKDEAAIEMRRENHLRIFKEYKREHCGKNGEQECNLTEEEQDGMKRITKRRDDKEAIIMKTDKSGKFTVATIEKYLEMGMSHVKGDREINRDEIRVVERLLNGHCTCWGKMFGSGENHNHLARICKSKCTKSTQVSNLYMMHKDHKVEPEKGRAVATATTSNTTGLSNAVSDYIESLANSIENPIETISTEDMLNRVDSHNREVVKMREEFEERRGEKMCCKTCKIR